MLLTTQYLDEADQLASQIVIIDHGRVIAAGTPSELKGQGRARRGRGPPPRRRRPAAVARRPGAARHRAAPGRRGRRAPWPCRSTAATNSLLAAVRALDELGVAVDDIALRRPTLDEVFLDLTGQTTDTNDPARPPGGMTRRPP